MKESTLAMLLDVARAHDWSAGETSSAGGAVLYRVDHCLACSLNRHYHIDPSSGPDDKRGETKFTDINDRPLSLRQAVARGCDL